jgi:tetratricopeptide (TPR) repeat protein
MTRKKKRGNPLRIAVLVLLVAAAVYVNQFIVPTTPPLFIPTPTPTRSPASFLSDAQGYVKQGKYIQAVAAFEQAIQSDPTNINTYLDLARLEVLNGDYEKALDIASKALLLNNNNSLAHAVKGWAMARGGDYQGLAEIQNAIETDPGNALAYAYQAEILAQQQTAGKGDLTTIDKATAASRKAIDLAPNQMESHRARGLVLEMTGNYQEAIAEFEEAVKQNDNVADLHLALGRNYKSVDPPDYIKAVDEFNRAIAIRGTDPQPYVEIALTYLKTGDYAKAAQYASQAIQQTPSDPLLYGYLGTIYFRQHDYASAIEPLRLATRGGAATTSDNNTVEVKGLTLSNDTSAIYARYGLSLANTNACGEALQISQTLTQAFPNDETVAYNAGAIVDTCKGGTSTPAGGAPTPAETGTPGAKETPKP